jgi:uncharacterized protein YcbX
MIVHVGHVHQLVRYPMKSMAGVATNSALLGWHGLQGAGAHGTIVRSGPISVGGR